MGARSAANGLVLALAIFAVMVSSASLPEASGAEPGVERPSRSTWRQAPIVPGFDRLDRRILRNRVAAARRAGRRLNVFMKAGDSNTEFSPNLYGLGCRQPTGLPRGLRPVLVRLRSVRLPNGRAVDGCARGNPFTRRSFAAQGAVVTSWLTTPSRDLPAAGFLARPPGCGLDWSPLDCEIATTKPVFALVLIGTNDLALDQTLGTVPPGSRTGGEIDALVRLLLARRIVPVLSTIPPVIDPDRQGIIERGIERTNRGIWRVSRKWRVPMINLHRALSSPRMINQGLAADGLHLGVLGAAGRSNQVDPEPDTLRNSVDFSPRGLRFGANRRNLVVLRTLTRLYRIVG